MIKYRFKIKILSVLLTISVFLNVSQCYNSLHFDTEKEMLESNATDSEFKSIDIQKENIRLQKQINLLEKKNAKSVEKVIKKSSKKTIQKSEIIPKNDSTKILSPEVSDTTKFLG